MIKTLVKDLKLEIIDEIYVVKLLFVVFIC